jgi:hypothetical protein
MALFLGQTLGALVIGAVIGFADYRVAFGLVAVGVAGLAWWARR